MAQKITLLELAKILNVSRTTASNAFNRPDQLSEELRNRILNKAKELGYYGPNPAGRLLRTGKAGAIGVIFFQEAQFAFSDEMALRFMAGVASVSDQEKTNLMILPYLHNQMEVSEIFSAAVDGFIIHSNALSDEVIDQINIGNRNLVTVDHQIRGVPSVCVDNILGGKLAAKHLLNLGHRNIAILSFELPELSNEQIENRFAAHSKLDDCSYSVASQRLLGYRQGFQDANIDFTKVPIILRPMPEPGKPEMLDDLFGYQQALRLFQEPNRPTALLCMSDKMASGVYKAAYELGIRIPEQLSIVGFDDNPSAARVSPPLTTLHQDGFLKGETAAKMLFFGDQSKLFEPTLVIRESTQAAS